MEMGFVFKILLYLNISGNNKFEEKKIRLI